MATTIKRKNESENVNKNARLKTTDDADEKLNSFSLWCEENNFQVSAKVRIQREGSCAQYGMKALEDITEGYCLFQVPRSALLMPANSDISDLLKRDSSIHDASNQWIPLLLTLLYEHGKTDSKWAPYLNISPDSDAIDLPMFWERKDVVRLLGGTGVDLAVERDIEKIENDFRNLVLPFIQRHKDKFSEKIDLDLFKRMVAFVMAYSFTEPAGKEKQNSEADTEDSDDEDEEDGERMLPPMMVPMADMLNHITRNNAKLTFGKEALKMVASQFIKKDEEVYNTYGQVSNLHLMQMYGFAEPFPDCTNDVVEVPVESLLSAAKDGVKNGKDELDTKWDFLKKQDIIMDSDVIVIGKEGIINDDVCTQVLKVVCMSAGEFSQYVENEGWSDADSEASGEQDDSSLSLEKCSQLSHPKKLILKRMCELHLEGYSTTPDNVTKKLATIESLSAREKYALYTTHSQQTLLQALIKTCDV